MQIRFNKSIIALTLIFTLSEILNTMVFFILISALLFIYMFTIGVPKQIFKINFALISILLIGIFGGGLQLIFSNFILRDVIRDIYMVATPILFISFGIYWFQMKKISIDELYKSIIFSAAIISIRHLILILINVQFIMANKTTRGIGGMSSTVTLLGIVIMTFMNKEQLKKIIPKKIHVIIINLLLSLSFILYFSRNNIVTLAAFLGLFIITRKTFNLKFLLKSIISAGIISLIIYCFIPKSMIEPFLNKSLNSLQEISFRNVENWNFTNINHNWRGYESYRAQEVFNNGNFVEKIVGFGFGKSVNLGINILLGNEKFSEISILHNGYYYILIKCGIVGVILYALFFVKMLFNLAMYSIKNNKKFEYFLLSGIALSILLVTYVVSGLYNRGSIFIYCFLIGFISYYLKINNIRNNYKNGGFKYE